MSKTTRAKKWVAEHQDGIVIAGVALSTLGCFLWLRHLSKSALEIPVAFQLERLDDNTVRVFGVFADGSVASKVFTQPPGA